MKDVKVVVAPGGIGQNIVGRISSGRYILVFNSQFLLRPQRTLVKTLRHSLVKIHKEFGRYSKDLKLFNFYSCCIQFH